jgi:hypothetical protein
VKTGGQNSKMRLEFGFNKKPFSVEQVTFLRLFFYQEGRRET